MYENNFKSILIIMWWTLHECCVTMVMNDDKITNKKNDYTIKCITWNYWIWHSSAAFWICCFVFREDRRISDLLNDMHGEKVEKIMRGYIICSKLSFNV